ncbi:hypothetical protein [Streptomyces sp. NPDC048442]|uniref:hypothetical protein n=1 Tax=Streptomyces sp. NPDC048442 TaxID=3154823 RepID=UPI00343C495C
MKALQTLWVHARSGWNTNDLSHSQKTEYECLLGLFKEGGYEEAEAGARALAASPRRPWARGPVSGRVGRFLATGAAVAHGRGAEVKGELEALIKEMEPLTGSGRVSYLMARTFRVRILLQQGEYARAEADTEDLLQATNISAPQHPADTWPIQQAALVCLADAQCGQGRYTEAEAIARGNLPRADDFSATNLRTVLVRSLNGQVRFEEALAEARTFAPRPSVQATGALDIAVATALYGTGDRPQALQTAHRALAACEQHLHPIHPRISEARMLVNRITAGHPLP